MIDIIYNHPLLIIICAMVLGYLGKYLWVSKDEEQLTNKFFTGEIHNLEQRFTNEIHNLELRTISDFSAYPEKMRIIQGEIMTDVDKKYFTKEMAQQHDERISKIEEAIKTILPRMEKIDMMYDLIKTKTKS